MASERFLKTLRSLAECYHGFELLSGRHVRLLGYTAAQFDILATLGNTPGMTFKELGERTLITKGTLTGVVDRLEAQGVVKRTASPVDGRSTTLSLTARGVDEFGRVFPLHIAYLKEHFSALTEREMSDFERLAGKLQASFNGAME
jgi:DNA-binding MarR family transcriptional regulator